MAGGKNDRNLEELIQFCKNFDTQYLSIIRDSARYLKSAAGSATATLGNTQFSTSASRKLQEAAEKLQKAVQTGEERILEYEKKYQQEKDEYERAESMLR